ncbi:MAG TPA: hypothetical protein VEY08_14510 [Chloroflexia bacterium]|nr:hypothetical protein [Chloroflexia bacterium]
MNPLAGFSDWAMALLPRLFLYPGGLAIAAALVLALFTSRPSAGTSVVRQALSLRANANILPLALAWAMLSVLPVPGTAPLPFPVDRFSIVAIVAASLLFDLIASKERPQDELWPSLAILLALVSPLAWKGGLMQGSGGEGVSGYLAGAATLVGLAGLCGGTRYGWSAAARWLAWWGAALALGELPAGAWGLVTLPAAIVLGWAAQRLGWGKYATLLAYLLALGALATGLPRLPG